MQTAYPIEVFISYAHEDDKYCAELRKHLRILEHRNLISTWHDRKIRGGDDWEGKISSHLESSKVILLLISSDFISSNYCYDVEMNRALEREDEGSAEVIPIIIRPCVWAKSPFSRLNALPFEGKPVTSWDNQDEAYTEITQKIGDIVEAFDEKELTTSVRIKKEKSTLVGIPDSSHLIGRESETKKLTSFIQSHKMVVIEGLSGIGKTSLALQFGNNLSTKFDAIIWSRIEDDSTLQSLMLDILSQVNNYGFPIGSSANDKRKNPDRIKTFIRLLQSKKILLVLDSFENCLAKDDNFSSEFFPLLKALFENSYRSRVLITTKRRLPARNKYHTQYKIFHLQGLSQDDSYDFIRNLTISLNLPFTESDAKEILNATKGHPYWIQIIVRLLSRGHPLSKLLIQKKGVGYLESLYNDLSEESKRLFEACSAFRRPFDYEALKSLPAKREHLGDLVTWFLLEYDATKKLFDVHNMPRELGLRKLRESKNHRHNVYREIGNYYYAKFKGLHNHKSFDAILLIIEASYHYQKINYRTGLINIEKVISGELSSYIRHLISQGERKIGKRMYEISFSVTKNNSEIHNHYARLLEWERTNPDKTEYHYHQAVKITPSNPDNQTYYLRWLIKRKKFNEAQKAFKLAVNHCPANEKIYTIYSKDLIEAGFLKEAESVLDIGVKNLKPRVLTPIYTQYSDLLVQQQKLDDAIKLLDLALEKIPAQKSTENLYLKYSQILQKQGKYREAENILRLGLSRLRKISSVTLFWELSQLLKKQGKDDLAEDVLKKGIKTVPPTQNLYSLYRGYSDLLRSKGNSRKAATVLQEGIKRIPPKHKLGDLILEYCTIMWNLGEYQDAENAFENGINILPQGRDLTTLNLHYANFLYRRRRTNQAISVLDKAIKTSPKKSLSLLRRRGKELIQKRKM